jgi:uncharacterized protein
MMNKKYLLLFSSFILSINTILLTEHSSIASFKNSQLYNNQGRLIAAQTEINEDEVLADIYQDHSAKLTTFLNAGGNPNRFLHQAVNNGAMACVKIMLKRGANVDSIDINNDNLTPLMVAARHTYRVGAEMSELLVKYGANVHARASKGSTPIMFAAWGTADHYEDEYVKVVKLLIKNGAKVNVKNKMGTTPLSIARSGKWKKIAATLVRAGAKS